MDKDGKIIAYLNGGPDSGSFLGWSWIQQNKGNPIALGVGARRDQIRLANIYGHGRADYLVIDDETGAVTAWENEGSDDLAIGSWRWTSRGQIASGIGKEAGVRFADYDGRSFRSSFDPSWNVIDHNSRDMSCKVMFT